MREYKVKAIVLNLGMGEREFTDYVRASNEKEAQDRFIEKHMTIEVKEVHENIYGL